MPVSKDHDRHYAAISAEVEAYQKAPWTCLVCGTVNSRMLVEGCESCGSGTAVASKAPPEPPRPTRSHFATGPDGEQIPAFRSPTAAAIFSPDQAALAAAARFLQSSPQAGVIDAYLAGYAEASRTIRDGMLQHQRPAPPIKDGWDQSVPPVVAPPPVPTPSPPEVGGLSPEGKASRTICAALALFRDQVLVEGPEEVATGEWCSVEETTALIERMQQEQYGYDTDPSPE